MKYAEVQGREQGSPAVRTLTVKSTKIDLTNECSNTEA